MSARRRSTRLRRGYSLMELAVATGIGAMLVGSMGSSVYIASQTLDLVTGPTTNNANAARAIDQMTRDLEEALTFTERTTTAVEFTVPDRDEDGQRETIRYAWSGQNGDPLTYEYNGAAGEPLLPEVQELDFGYFTRTIDSPIPR